jgi:5-methylphenazine-1-carboxylate 1-monooxygenase
MKVLIAGGGIGGLTTALALHQAGFETDVFEQAREFRELGVGINLLPHAVKHLQQLGLQRELDQVGIRTRSVVFATRLGQQVWYDPRGLDAGYDTPQVSVHRGRLQSILLDAVRARLGSAHVHPGSRLLGFRSDPRGVVAEFEHRSDLRRLDVAGDALIGADGIHSTVRSLLYPYEGPPVWNGIMVWRGAREWPVYADGRTMLVAGGNAAKFVVYPIHADAARPGVCLTNWAVAARVGDGSAPPPRREDWNRPGRLEEALPFVRDHFRIDRLDPAALVEATEPIFEYPMCDRDPLPRWSFGPVTLLGDAAHPMYPTGSNGASQAILDAAALTRHLRSGGSISTALQAYDDERRPATAAVVYANRQGGSEGVIDLVEARAPNGFDELDRVATYAERAAIVSSYARLAGYALEQVNRS